MIWPYLLVASLLINGALLLWWPRSATKKNTAAQPSEHNHAYSIEHRETANTAGIKTKDVGSENSPAPQAAQSGPLPAAASSNAPNLPAESVKADRSATPPPGSRHGDKGKTPDYRELPASLKQELPELNISGHFYDADPAGRLIVVNGRTLREGQDVSVGLKLEQITASGAVFSYQGSRFSKGVF